MRPGRGAGQGAVSHTKGIMHYIDSGVFNGGNFKFDISFVASIGKIRLNPPQWHFGGTKYIE